MLTVQEEVRARRSVFVLGEVQRDFPASSESWVSGSEKGKKEDKFFSSLLGFKVFHPRFDWAESRLWKKLRGSRNENRKKSNTTFGAPFRRSPERKREKKGKKKEDMRILSREPSVSAEPIRPRGTPVRNV